MVVGKNSATRSEQIRAAQFQNNPQAQTTDTGMVDSQEKTNQKNFPSNLNDDPVTYTKGLYVLLKSRREIAISSLKKSKERLKNEIKIKSIDSKAKISLMKEEIIQSTLLSSHICDQNILFHIEMDNNCNYAAISSCSGISYLCSLQNVENSIKTLQTGFESKCTSTAFSPNFNLDEKDSSSVTMATSYTASMVALWNPNVEEPVALIKRKCGRIRRVQFYPLGNYIGYCCADKTWRFCDLNTQQEILQQPGHSDEVLCLKFHQDGSLVFTGSTDTYSRVWDLRTGKCIMVFSDHNEAIMDLDINLNGYQIATASADNSVNLYDLRKGKLFSTIPAHSSNVSTVKFDKKYGKYLFTGSYDSTIKCWAYPSGIPIKTLSGHSDKVTGFDVNKDCSTLISVSFDRTYKRWAKDDLDMSNFD